MYTSISYSSIVEKDRIPQSENDFTPKLNSPQLCKAILQSIFPGMLGIITMCTQDFLGVEKMNLLFQVFPLLVFLGGGRWGVILQYMLLP